MAEGAAAAANTAAAAAAAGAVPAPAGAGPAAAVPAPAPAAGPAAEPITETNPTKMKINTLIERIGKIKGSLNEALSDMKTIVPDIDGYKTQSPISYLLHNVNTQEYFDKILSELYAINAFLTRTENTTLTQVPYKTYATFATTRKWYQRKTTGGKRKYTLRRIKEASIRGVPPARIFSTQPIIIAVL
jgi:hypothetical protein